MVQQQMSHSKNYQNIAISYLKTLLYILLCVCVCVWACTRTYMEVRGQLTGAGSLLLPWVSVIELRLLSLVTSTFGDKLNHLAYPYF